MKQHLNWGVVGTGGIASDFVQALQGSKRCEVVSVVGSKPAKGRAFAERWGLAGSAPSLEAMLANDHVEAIYIATPHPLHEAQVLACIAAGKAVLCEKPLTVDAQSAQRVLARAREQGTFVGEAFMYRCHPLLTELIERLKSGAIGKLVHVRADFCFRIERDPKGRLFDLSLGGGSILDVGGYPLSLARLLAGLVVNEPFAEPVSMTAVGSIGPTGADEFASALLKFESGFTAAVSSATRHDMGTFATIIGEEGKVVLPDPWIPRGVRQGLETEFYVHRDGGSTETVSVRTELPTYAIEAEKVADWLPASEPQWPAMSWADTLGNLRAMDQWRAALG